MATRAKFARQMSQINEQTYLQCLRVWQMNKQIHSQHLQVWQMLRVSTCQSTHERA